MKYKTDTYYPACSSSHSLWVDELTLAKESQVGEIQSKNEYGTAFEDEMSNKLPAGIKIFSAEDRNDILIAESEDQELYYVAIAEGWGKDNS